MASETGAAALDRQAIAARLGASAALLQELAGMLLEDCSRWLPELHSALRRGDAAGLRFTAHLLCGSVGSLEQGPTSRAAAALEARALAADLDGAAAALADLVEAFEHLRPALTELAGPAQPGGRP